MEGRVRLSVTRPDRECEFVVESGGSQPSEVRVAVHVE
jgi:hypothetical protein